VARAYLNQTSELRRQRGLLNNSIELHLKGNPQHGVTRSAFNAVVRMTTTVDGKQVVQSRQLIGPGGHNGKTGDLIVHFGLGDADRADEIRINWPTPDVQPTVLKNVTPGLHQVEQP